MEDGCNETCARLLAWGSEDREQDTLGRAMSCSLRRLFAFEAASIGGGGWRERWVARESVQRSEAEDLGSRPSSVSRCS